MHACSVKSKVMWHVSLLVHWSLLFLLASSTSHLMILNHRSIRIEVFWPMPKHNNSKMCILIQSKSSWLYFLPFISINMGNNSVRILTWSDWFKFVNVERDYPWRLTKKTGNLHNGYTSALIINILLFVWKWRLLLYSVHKELHYSLEICKYLAPQYPAPSPGE